MISHPKKKQFYILEHEEKNDENKSQDKVTKILKKSSPQQKQQQLSEQQIFELELKIQAIDLSAYQQDEPLGKDFYCQDSVILARELLGKTIVRQTDKGLIKAVIVETEAYRAPQDKASHGYGNKQTEKNKYLWLEGGHVYMFSVYGNNCCINIVAARIGEPQSVLLRAVEPIEGIDLVKENRGETKSQSQSKNPRWLTGGPGKLTKALRIDKSFSGYDLRKKGDLYICKGNYQKFEIQSTKRINIDYAGEWKNKLWRYIIKGNKYLSA